MSTCHLPEVSLAREKPTIVLAGNPNSGKTTLFNTLTGLRQHVSNYPGTTVALAQGMISDEKKSYLLIDVPGTYSLKPYADDEAVACEILKDCRHEAVIAIIDPAHLERSLSLVIELADQEIPLGIFVNETRGLKVAPDLVTKLEEVFGVPVVIADASLNSAKSIFFKLISRVRKTKSHAFPDLVSAAKRLRFIRSEFAGFAIDAYAASRGIDRMILHPFFGLPIFLAVMWLLFQITFTLGAYPADWLEILISRLGEGIKVTFADSIFTGIFVDGILGGVAATIVFLPQIALLFALMAVLEQSGYLARAAYLLERIMGWCGLHGRSAVPLLMGFGCNVPAIMAIRSLPTHREKVTTALMLPFISCSARLPVLTLLVGAFVLEAWQGTVFFALYAVGIFSSFLTALLLKSSLKGKTRPLLLELPIYRLPRAKSLLLAAWGAVKHFLRRAGRILVPLAIILWVLFSYPAGSTTEESYAGQVGHFIAPIFEPLGFDWRTTTGLIAGVAAKEVYVATVGTLYALEDSEDTMTLTEKIRADESLDGAAVAALLTFIVLYTPCIAVIATMRAELGKGWAVFGAIYPTVFAYFMAYAVRSFYLLLTVAQ